MGRCVSFVKKRKEHASTLEGDTSKNKQKSRLQQLKQKKIDIFGMKVQNCGLMEI